LSVFFTLVSVGGVVAIWIANGPVTESSMMKSKMPRLSLTSWSKLRTL
jgi:hypothetical protein